MHRYEIIINWSDEDKVFVAEVGESLYQCEQELRSSLEGWLIVKIRHGDKLPVIGKINLNNKMPDRASEI